MATSGADWALVAAGFVSGAATATAAGFTAWMAAKTRALAGETTEMAKETKRMADATKQDADASQQLVRETLNDRALAIRPVLVIRGLRVQDGMLAGPLEVMNIGNGAALNCVAAFESRPPGAGEWVRIPGTFDIGVAPNFWVGVGQINHVWQGPRPAGEEGMEGYAGAIVCRDVLDYRHLLRARVRSDNSLAIVDRQTWSPLDPACPPWLTSEHWGVL